MTTRALAPRFAPRWRKVLGDVRESPARALLVGLAICIGTAATGTALGARAILGREVPRSYLAAHPAAVVFTLDSVPDGLVARVRARPGVVDAEARRLVRARVEVAPGDWRPLLLYGVADFRTLRVSAFRPVSGAWPPPDGTILVERSALSVLAGGMGAPSVGATAPRTLHVRAPGGTLADVPVSGIVHDPAQAPGWQDNAAYAYTSAATLARLGQGGHLDEIRVAVAGDRDAATRVADDVGAWLASEGLSVQRAEVPLREHPHTDHMRTMLTLLTAFGALALLLAGALTANVVAALLARQVRQIGVMKAVGATAAQVVCLYLTMVAAIAAPAALVGAALAGTLARAFARFAAEQLNLDVASTAVPTSAVALQLLLGTAVPLAAVAIPVLRAARVTVRDAIQHVGIRPPAADGRARTTRGATSPAAAGTSADARARATWGAGPARDRRLAFALRSVFRRPVRLGLTVGALALGGAALMTAANVYTGLLRAVDRALVERGDDIDVRLLRPAPREPLIARVRAIPGVVNVEAWGHALAAVGLESASRPEARVTLRAGTPSDAPIPASDRADGPRMGHSVSTGRYALLAPPPDSRLLRLPVVEGRWLRPGETGAVVVDRGLQAREPALVVGAEVTLVVAGPQGRRRTPVRVVGAVEAIEEPSLYTTPATLATLTEPHRGRLAWGATAVAPPTGTASAGALRIVTAPGAQARVATAVEHALADAGWFPVFVMTRDALRRAMTDHFLILLALLSAVAAASVAVGALTLGTSVALNALERTREIGVLRAMGAGRTTIRRLLLLEGAAAAALSAVVAAVVALPLSLVVGTLVGRHGLHVAVPFVVAPAGVVGWFTLVGVIAYAACAWPARRALRPAVRDVLAYE